MSNAIQASSQQAQRPKVNTGVVASKPAASSQAPKVASDAPLEKVSLSGGVPKDSRGIPLPKPQQVKVERWGSGNNDKACLEGILRSGGYSQQEIYSKGPDGKSLLAKVAAQNGLKDPNLVQPGKSISFVPREEREIYEARSTTARRDESLMKLAQDPVKTEQGSVSPQHGFKAIADASLDRMGKAHQNLPEAGRKGVEEQLTVVASNWSKTPGNPARFERASAEDKQTFRQMWLAQAASQYARSPGAQGKKSDLIHLGDGARQYIDAQSGLLKTQVAPSPQGETQSAASDACPAASGPSVDGPRAPLPALINAWGQVQRDVGQQVSNLGSWAQGGVNRAVDSWTRSVDGHLQKEMGWASQHSPSAGADIAVLGAVGASAHFVGGAVKGVARFGTGFVEGAGSLVGAGGTTQQYLVNDRVHGEVNAGIARWAQDPSAPIRHLGQQVQASWNKDQAGFLGELTGFASAVFFTGGLAGAGRGVAAADDVIPVTVRAVSHPLKALPGSPTPVGLLPPAAGHNPIGLLPAAPSPAPAGLAQRALSY